jgi:hypothetical protein
MTKTVYLSPVPEEQVLANFWQMVGDGGDRIQLLRLLTTVAIRRPPDWSKESAREVFYPYPANCFCCLSAERKLYWHHVITVNNGGSKRRQNLVAICLRCHAAVHPWLPADRPGERLGAFETVHDLIDEVRRALPRTDKESA